MIILKKILWDYRHHFSHGYYNDKDGHLPKLKLLNGFHGRLSERNNSV